MQTRLLADQNVHFKIKCYFIKLRPLQHFIYFVQLALSDTFLIFSFIELPISVA